MQTPLALFSYNRHEKVTLALESLSRCRRFEELKVVVYCDGPKRGEDQASVEGARRTVRQWQQRLGFDVVERTRNFGLAKSIVSGTTELCGLYGRVIVIEDDLVLAPDFLDYMLEALDKYENEANVYQISGYMFPVDHPDQPDAFFLPLTTTWGWATWARAWKHFDWNATGYVEGLQDPQVRRAFDFDDTYPYSELLRRRMEGKNDSWGILWWWSVFNSQGLVLHPRRTLVWLGGFDGSGTHCGTESELQQVDQCSLSQPSLSYPLVLPRGPSVDEAALQRIKEFLRLHAQQPAVGKIKRLFTNVRRRAANLLS